MSAVKGQISALMSDKREENLIQGPKTRAKWRSILALVCLLWLALPYSLAAGPGLNEPYGRLPLSFEPNHGQAPSHVRFLSRALGHVLLLSPNELIWQQRGGTALRMKAIGANVRADLVGLDPLPGKSNYFLGQDSRQWRTGIHHYARVRYRDVYPGIDLVVYGSHSRLEYDFVISPGKDPAGILLAFSGPERVFIDERGDLVLRTAAGEFRQPKPTVYQEVSGVRRRVDGRYVLRGRGCVGFRICGHDPKLPLVIDPVLSYSTYLGGSGDEGFDSRIAVDSAGNAYVVGTTDSPNFPTIPGAQLGSLGATDVFIAKLDPEGSALLYSTVLGGSRGDSGFDIEIDSAGNAYVTGKTSSLDFPTTPGALRTASSGGAFVVKLNTTGAALIYSTYLDSAAAEAYGIAVDAAGSAYVTGTTFSAEFPTTPGALQRTIRGGNDIFIAKLSAAGNTLVYSTFLGGTANETASSIAVDGAGSAYVAGGGHSRDFPTTPGAFQRTKGAGESEDAFIAKLTSDGSALVYSTYLGGSGPEGAVDLAIDSVGNAYLTGLTFSTDFPTTPGAFQRTLAGNSDAFVTKLNAQGRALVYSTLLGGPNNDGGASIAVDSAASAYLTGTSSRNFPVTTDAFQAALRGSTDAFVAKLNVGGSLAYSTFLGGDDNEGGTGIAIDPTGNAYVVGITGSGNFPTTPGSRQTFPAGGRSGDAFIAKVADGPSRPPLTSVSAASFLRYFPLAPESIASAFGQGFATTTQAATTLPLPTSLGGVSVRVSDSAGVERLAPLFFVSPTQINYLVPESSKTGPATVTMIRTPDQVVATETIQIDAVGPGLFSANADGRGVAAAVAVRVASDSSQTPLPVFECGAAPGSCVPVPIDIGSESDQVILMLFGTGIRGRTALSTVHLGPGGVRGASLVNPALLGEVLYAGPQPDFVGLDQINIRLPRNLMGRGEFELNVSVDGKSSNAVKIHIR